MMSIKKATKVTKLGKSMMLEFVNIYEPCLLTTLRTVYIVTLLSKGTHAWWYFQEILQQISYIV